MWTLLFVLLSELSLCSYNVENLLRPTTEKNWTYTRYDYKLGQVAKVIASCSGWKNPAIVGLCEVENDTCVYDLCRKMRNLNYRYIHYDSPDVRGIDVALLYDSTQVKKLASYPVRVYLDRNTTTRDILYAKFYVVESYEEGKERKEGRERKGERDTLHVFQCHFPSQLSGKTESDWKRKKAFEVLQAAVDSILGIDPEAKIIAMGDFNCPPKENLYAMHNLALEWKKMRLKLFRQRERIVKRDRMVEGTHKYHGIWEILDQVYISPSMVEKAAYTIYGAEFLLEKDKKYLGKKPYRTYNGYKWQGGYSDHLPIVVIMNL